MERQPRRRRLTVALPAALMTLAVVPVTGAVIAPASASTAVAAAPPPDCPWMDTTKTPDQRARLLLRASTLNQELRWLDEQAANNPTQTTFGPANAQVTYPIQVPCTPTVVYTDGPDYVRGSVGVTVFPAQIALAASWHDGLAYDKGAAQADEAFQSRKNVILGPGIASGRTPLSGRTPEYLGEDSLLSGNLAASMTKGIQEGPPADEAVM